MKIFGREPTLWIGAISAGIILLGTFGFRLLNAEQAGLIVAAINAIALAVNAYTVRPISPTTFTYAVGAMIALAGGYGLHFSAEQVAGLNALVVPFLVLLSRNQVSPADTPLTRTTTSDEKAVAEPGTGAAPSATVEPGPRLSPS